jgi:hypothetical protein
VLADRLKTLAPSSTLAVQAKAKELRARGVLDALRRVEVGLSGAEGDHVDALRPQLLGLGLHGER